MCPEVLAEVLKGLLIFRDALVSILLKNAIPMSQKDYSTQYDKVICSACLYAEGIMHHSSECLLGSIAQGACS